MIRYLVEKVAAVAITRGLTFAMLLVFCGGAAWERVLQIPEWELRKQIRGVLVERAGAEAPWADELHPDYAPISALVVGASEAMDTPEHRLLIRDMAVALDGETPFVVLVASDEQKQKYEETLWNAGVINVYVVAYPRDSIWLRDYGPVFVRNEEGVFGIVDGSYTGGSPVERWRDDECPIVMSNVLRLPLVQVPLRFQGGNILPLDEKRLITTHSVFDENRSRGYSRAATTREMKKRVDLERWLCVLPLFGEKTRHVDMIVSALSPETVVVAAADPERDPSNAGRLDLTARLMEQEGVNVHRIPLPFGDDGYFRSYNNIVIANDVVLVPRFSDVSSEVEAEVMETYRELMPGKRVVGVNCDSLLQFNGLLRCITTGIPEGVNWQRLLDIRVEE